MTEVREGRRFRKAACKLTAYVSEMIEKCSSHPEVLKEHPDIGRIVFRMISRNETKNNRKASEEEFLLEIVDHFKDAFLADLANIGDKDKEEDYEVLYPSFMERVAKKAEDFKRNAAGFRQLCCLPRFALALVMMSRVRSHYTHCDWFNIGTLKTMIEVHGGVSEPTGCSASRSADRDGQFLAEHIVESVENLERMCNEEAPPMTLAEINEKREAFYVSGWNPAEIGRLREEMKDMEKTFRLGRGDLKQWEPEVLAKIDESFKAVYQSKGESFDISLYFPDCRDSVEKFQRYCDKVDQILRENPSGCPPYAREYFAYYSIWEMRGYRFPVPLGTATAIEALDATAANCENGFIEVSDHDHMTSILPSDLLF